MSNSTVTLAQNTTKEYPCTMCGSSGNIVREDPVNPRLKCNSCGFMYNGQDSVAAKEAGTIPDGPPELPKEEPWPVLSDESLLSSGTKEMLEEFGAKPRRLPLAIALPRTPTHVLLSKDRRYWEFVTKRNLKREVLKWTAEERSFDLFELTLKKVDAKIEIN